MRVGLRAICHEADVLKAALRPITAQQKLWLVAGIGARVSIRPSLSLVGLTQCATFDKEPHMKMLLIAPPAKSVLVLKFSIFVVIDENRGKSVRLEQFCYFHSV